MTATKSACKRWGGGADISTRSRVMPWHLWMVMAYARRSGTCERLATTCGAPAPRGSCAARGARADPLLSGGGGCARHLPRDLDRKVLLAHHPRERRHPVPALPQHHLPRRARPRGSARRAALAAGRGGADRVRLDFGGFVVGNLLEALHLPGARDGARALVLGAACARGGGRVAGARGPPLS